MPSALQTISELVDSAQLLPGAEGSVLVARVKGEINLHNSPALRNDLLRLVEEESPRSAVVNLAEVSYMDSSAIAVLVELLKAIRANGGVVYLTNLQKRVNGLLHIARLDSIFQIREDETRALSDLGTSADPTNTPRDTQ
jgi:anti-sigma B factor antagonist